MKAKTHKDLFELIKKSTPKPNDISFTDFRIDDGNMIIPWRNKLDRKTKKIIISSEFIEDYEDAIIRDKGSKNTKFEREISYQVNLAISKNLIERVIMTVKF